jgi:hypothetical protein
VAWPAVFRPVRTVEPPPPREVLLEPNVVVLTSPSCSFFSRESVGDLSGRAKPPWSATGQARHRRMCSDENRVGERTIEMIGTPSAPWTERKEGESGHGPP